MASDEPVAGLPNSSMCDLTSLVVDLIMVVRYDQIADMVVFG